MDYKKIIHSRLDEAKTALKNGHNEQAEFDAALISAILELYENQARLPEQHDAKGKVILSNPPETFDDYAILIECDLGDAERDAGWHLQTKDESYKQIAKQRLSHAQFFIEKAKGIGKSQDSVDKIKMWKSRHDDIIHRMSK